MTACKILDEFIDARLLREEKQCWVEKAVVTRIWADTTGSVAEPPFESLKNLFENVFRNTKHPFSAPATHAAQTVSEKMMSEYIALRVRLITYVAATVETSRSSVRPRSVYVGGVVVSNMPSPTFRQGRRTEQIKDGQVRYTPAPSCDPRLTE
jgi:hypothetical protein